MEWINPRYKQIVADIRARQQAEAKEGRQTRPLRGFIVPPKD
ncbi:hypothetical protein [Streptomyces sp. A3M-1-3]|nr:hypothetical protein [Streptomyces sp. A3M-1-3]